MKKLTLLAGVLSILFLFQACSSKNYELKKSPTVVFKTTMGDLKIRLYESAAPKASKWFVKFAKKYQGSNIDEVIYPNYVINIGNNSKVFDPSVKESFKDEVAPKKKKVEKNELVFDPKNEGFGFFSIYTGPTAIDANETLVVFGKVVESDKTLNQIMNVRVDKDYKPNDAIRITGVEIIK